MKTATERYQERMNNIESMLQSITEHLQRHAEAQKRNPKNWGYAGDLGMVETGLKDIESFISGHYDMNGGR